MPAIQPTRSVHLLPAVLFSTTNLPVHSTQFATIEIENEREKATNAVAFLFVPNTVAHNSNDWISLASKSFRHRT